MSPPFVRDFRLSGFKPSTGMTSFAKDSHVPDDFPKLFIEIGKTSFATDSSSVQQVFGHESSLDFGSLLFSSMSSGTAILKGFDLFGIAFDDSIGFLFAACFVTGFGVGALVTGALEVGAFGVAVFGGRTLACGGAKTLDWDFSGLSNGG